MQYRTLLLSSIAVIALAAAPALAQGQDDNATLTTEMVPSTAPEPETTASEAPSENGATAEERADAERSKATVESASEPGGGEKGPSADEVAWRAHLAAVEQAARDAQARAEEAELQLNDLRNDINATQSTVDERNALAAQIQEQAQVIQQAREEAAQARAALEQTKQYGQANRYSENPGPKPTTAGGAPNPAYYKAQAAEASQDATDASRRIEVYQNRVAALMTQINMNSGSGDSFAQAKLNEELQAARDELEKAQMELTKAEGEMEEAKDNGARVP